MTNNACRRIAPEYSLTCATMSYPGLSMPGSVGAANTAAVYSTANAMPAIIGVRRSMLHPLCAAATLSRRSKQS